MKTEQEILEMRSTRLAKLGVGSKEYQQAQLESFRKWRDDLFRVSSVVEQQTVNLLVVGSTPTRGARFLTEEMMMSNVHDICLLIGAFNDMVGLELEYLESHNGISNDSQFAAIQGALGRNILSLLQEDNSKGYEAICKDDAQWKKLEDIFTKEGYVFKRIA